MKKILILFAIAALLAPTVVLAAGAGGSANRYKLLIDKVVWPRTPAVPDSTTITLSAGTTGFGIVGVIDTSQVYDASELVCPFGAGAFMGFSAKMTAAAADSAGVEVQWSSDGTTWFGTNTVAAIIAQTPTVGLTSTASNLGVAFGQVAENATFGTTPMWKYIRFLVQHWDGSSKATAITSFTLWWHRYVKTTQ